MPNTVDLKVREGTGAGQISRIQSHLRNIAQHPKYPAERISGTSHEIAADIDDVNAHIMRIFGEDNRHSAFQNIYINGQSIDDLCKDEYDTYYEYEKGKGGVESNPNLYDLKCMVLYSAMHQRDKVIEMDVPDLENPEQKNRVYMRPEIEKRGNFFSRLWNSIKEAFGASGTNKDVLGRYDNLVEAREELNRTNTELEAELERTQPERDSLQRQMIEIASYDEIGEDDAVFFGREIFEEQFGKDAIDDYMYGGDMGLGMLFDEEKPKEVGSFASFKNSKMAETVNSLDLKTLSRPGSRVSFAKWYMLAQGHDIETIMSNSPEAIRAKKEAGKEIIKLLFATDKEEARKKITEMTVKGVEYLADEKNYPQFDITSDREIVHTIGTDKHKFASHIAKDLEQIMLYGSAQNKASPYVDSVKQTVGESVYDKYVNLASRYGLTSALVCDSRSKFILSDAYSKEYLKMPPQMQEYVDKEPFIGRVYAVLDTTHSMKEKSGGSRNIVSDIDSELGMMVCSSFGDMTLSRGYGSNKDALYKGIVDKQVVLGTKPLTTAKDEETRFKEEEFCDTARKRLAQAPKKDVSASFTQGKEPKQVTTPPPQKAPKTTEKTK